MMMSHNAERHARGDDGEPVTPTQGTDMMVANAPPPSMRPVDDALLMDMDWSALTAMFPAARIHADVCAGEHALFAVSEYHLLRTFALLPVKRWCEQSGATTEKWVPFLLSTGAPWTHFTPATVDALCLDTAHKIRVMDEPIRFHVSTGRFQGINVLGTDVLKCARVVIDYPTKVADIKRIPRTFWVKIGGAVMKVTPSEHDIDALKKAVVMHLQAVGARHILKMTVRKHDGTVCDRMDAPLEENTEETAYMVAL